MASNSSIEWTDKTWNPTRGCSLVSEGCRRCYAMKQAHRMSGPGKAYEGLTELGPDGPRWTGAVRTVPEMLDEPLRWKKPQRVFVNSMSDLFHEDVPFEFIDKVFAVMALCPQHTFQVLTKRPERMREYCRDPQTPLRLAIVEYQQWNVEPTIPWPLPNCWLGVSAENQQYADERIPLLLQAPAAVRFVSYEPALGPVDFTRLRPPGFTWFDSLSGRAHAGPSVWSGEPRLDWVIVGGESGPGARPFDLAWARSVVEQCQAASVACFVKQLGAFPVYEKEVGTAKGGCPVLLRLRDRKGGNMSEWAENLRIREFPKSPLP